jgi:hypothetical protein
MRFPECQNTHTISGDNQSGGVFNEFLFNSRGLGIEYEAADVQIPMKNTWSILDTFDCRTEI